MMYGNILFLLVVGVIIYMMMKKGGGCCGGHDHSGHDSSGSNKDADHAHHHMEIKSPENATDNDPVCGMEVKDHSIVSKHLGKTFHFCSEQCRNIFDLNPTKFSGA